MRMGASCSCYSAPFWLVPGGRRRGAYSRLPSTLFLRQACEAPSFVLRWYCTLASLIIPIYYVNWAVSEFATWVGVCLLWGSLVWTLSVKLASAIVFPGSLSITSRRFEHAIALEVKRRVEEITKEVLFRLHNSSSDFQTLPSNLTSSVDTYLDALATSMNKHYIPSGTYDEDDDGVRCIRALQSFVKSVKEWKQDNKNPELRLATITTADALLAETGSLLDARGKKKTLLHLAKASKTSKQRVSPEEEEDSSNEDNEDDDSTTTDEGITNEKDSGDDDDDDPNRQLQGENKRHQHQIDRNNKWYALWTFVLAQIEIVLSARKRFPGILSYDWARKHLELFHDGEAMLLDSHSYKIDVCYFLAKRPTTSASSGANGDTSQQVVVMCNPNAARYEQYALHPFWLDYYRSRQMNVLVWNFRGYGRSEGDPSPQSLREDIESIVKYVTEEKKNSKLLFHGESIGGIAACHAASLCGPDALLIADRTFSSLDAVAKALVGRALARILYIATGWTADNVQTFLVHASVSNRLLLQDPQDDIVRHRASLKIGVARIVFKGDVIDPVSPLATTEDVELQLPRIQTFFTRRQTRKFVQAAELLALAVSRPSFSAQIEQVETSNGQKVAFPAFPDETSFELTNAFVRVLLNIDGGHGQLFGKALVEELEKTRLEVQFQKSRLGQCTGRFQCKKKPGNDEVLNDNFAWDWFASCAVFRALPPSGAPDVNNNNPRAGGFTLENGIQAMKRLVQQQRTFPDSVQPHIITVLATLDAYVTVLSAQDNASRLRGVLVPLKCGHNGTPGKQDLARIEDFLIKSGWKFEHFHSQVVLGS